MDIGIMGASGYTGAELLRILAEHEVNVSVVTRSAAGGKVADTYPHLTSSHDMVFEANESEKLGDCDLVFAALPHGVSMKHIPRLVGETKIIDLSGDFRFKDTSVYENWYGLTHEAKELCDKAVYGLAELYRVEIKKAVLVANPGCYPTGAILGALPLVREKLVSELFIDAKTGVSGAGAKASESTHYSSVSDSVKAYKAVSHRHQPEIQKELGVKTYFTPHLVPMIRGILTTIHASCSIEQDALKELYLKYYEKEPFIRLVENASTNNVRGSNFCDVSVFADGERIVVTTAIDNLVKGASGQAVQNMNLMLGYEETKGLGALPLFP